MHVLGRVVGSMQTIESVQHSLSRGIKDAHRCNLLDDLNRAAPSAEGLRLTQAGSLLAVSLLVKCKAA